MIALALELLHRSLALAIQLDALFHDLLFPLSNVMYEVESLICCNSVKKLLVDMLSRISPLTSALSISE
jgi:hypothetical protein